MLTIYFNNNKCIFVLTTILFYMMNIDQFHLVSFLKGFLVSIYGDLKQKLMFFPMFMIIFLIPVMIVIKIGLSEMGIRANSLMVNLTIMKAFHMKIQV